GNEVAQEFGDLDFTNGGIEGPIGFKVSRKGVHALINGEKVELVLDLKPAVSLEQLRDRISREISLLKSRNLTALLRKLLPGRLVPLFIEANKDLSVSNMPEKLKNWKFKIVGNVGYERCVVTAGGVCLSEVSQKTLESKLVDSLYFAGEVLDLDADTGGFNLQIAFSTGALAAFSAYKKINATK
ncbi:MAG: NAD(P)/FAD-dependent oxidoreductase, partial [Bacteroidia bacterium]|nr:NAD(P)/FAD-dependent oxidoreductase [Bacteroidia bacterium]